MSDPAKTSPAVRLNNDCAPAAIIMPDGRQKIPLGSGVITAKLGEGGMAAVYEIWNSQLEVYHAVKLINPSCGKDTRERFQTEIKITAKLHHPNITEIHAVGEWNGIPFIEMEKMEGIDLAEVIAKRGALPVPVATSVAIMVARALDHAHSHSYQLYGKNYQGIIHRDLKPGNIMICTDGMVKLMDFGVARPTDASFHTMDGEVVGTLQYLSPEQLSGEDLDERTDIYAIGATLYEMLCGVPAFPEKNVHRLVADKSSNRYKPLEDFSAPIPADLRRLVRKCMVYDQHKRMSSARTLVEELEKVHRNMTDLSPELVMQKFVQLGDDKRKVLRSRNRVPYKTIAIAFLVIVAGVQTVRYGPLVLDKLRQSPATPAPPVVIRDTVRLAVAPVEKKEAPPRVKTIAPVVKKEPSGPSAAPASVTAPAVVKPKSMIDALAEKHGTSDILALMQLESRGGNHKTVVDLYERLRPDRKSTVDAVIYAMRSYEALGDRTALSVFLKNHPIEDSEYFLTGARSAWMAGDIQSTTRLIDRSLTAPRKFMDYEKLTQETAYYRALCVTATFDSDPSEANWKGAAGAWFEVKSLWKNHQQHMYYKKAEAEIRRIGEKYRQSREKKPSDDL